jgi:hypothetical protein
MTAVAVGLRPSVSCCGDRPSQPEPSRVGALAVLLAGTAVLYLWSLGREGWATPVTPAPCGR